jgi:hypothetical protein
MNNFVNVSSGLSNKGKAIVLPMNNFLNVSSGLSNKGKAIVLPTFERT